MRKFASTADKLMEFRIQLRRYYESQRNPKKNPVMKPSPDQFPMVIRHMVERIEKEELETHEKVLNQHAN